MEERRAQRQLWDDVRIAKERLSRAQSADFVVPLLDTEVHLTRDELEKVARPVLDQTVRVTKGLLRWADLPEGRLAGVFLVGGASRIPLVATLLHRELGEAPVVIEQPELVVAEGSILADAALLATGAAAPGPTAELRLISAGRAESATVHLARISPPAPPEHVPGTTGLQPPVDPWPDADPGHWLPDPQATVATAKPRFDGPPPVREGGVPPTHDSSISPAREGRAPHGREGGAPSGRGSAQSGREGREGGAPRVRERAPNPTPSRPMSPALPPTRPISSPPHTAGTAQVKRRPPAPPRPARYKPPRRRGRFKRFLQIMLSVLVMIVVPLMALVLSYGYGNGDPLQVDAENLVRDIRDLLGIRSSFSPTLSGGNLFWYRPVTCDGPAKERAWQK